MPWKFFLALCAAAIVAPGVATSAHVTVSGDFRSVVQDAELIVRGQVTHVLSVQGVGGRLDSIATVAVDDTLKGPAETFVSVRVPGGELGRTRVVMVGAPRLVANQSAVFFLKRSPDNVWHPVGLSAGILRVRRSASGRPSVQSPIASSRSALGARRSASEPALIPVEEFGAIVRVIVAGQTMARPRP